MIALAVLALLLAGVAAFALTRPGDANVPNILGDPVAVARDKVEDAGFEFAQRPAPTCSPDNTVTEQDPPAAAEAEEGSTVTATVSLGLVVDVPDVVGEREQAATERLEDEQLDVTSEPRSSRNVQAGRVISTDPVAGSEVDCKSTVTMFVSKGANTISLPDLIGQQQEVAESQLNRLGLIPDVDMRDADEPEGTVIGQDPGPESELLRGDQVTIVVSSGAGSVIVPDVVGQSEDSARSSLASRGLSVDVVEQETEDRSDDGRVLQQAPTPGSRVRSGDQVTIVVGVFVEPEEPTTTTTSDDPEHDHDDALMKVAVISGGRSSEHDVSLRSGASVAAGLREAGHEVVEVLIERDGRWTRERRGGRDARRPAACSAATSPSRSCTGPSARTARSRGCSSRSTSPTRARACSPRRWRWTSSSASGCSPTGICPRSSSARSASQAGASTPRRWAGRCG